MPEVAFERLNRYAAPIMIRTIFGYSIGGELVSYGFVEGVGRKLTHYRPPRSMLAFVGSVNSRKMDFPCLCSQSKFWGAVQSH
jgi:hypothetical protein